MAGLRMLSAPPLPATIASRYQPIRLIGKGGMGVVYEVVHARTGEHLALKVLQSSAGASLEALERFKREARAPAQIRSENVVHVSDADVAPELDDAPFLVMELLEGKDLEQAAMDSKPEPAVVVGWLRQIAPALDKAHRLGIIHRDLKPENLFLANVDDRPPVVKILDFGIAKMTEEGNASTVSGQVLGTPKYMAPEQAARHPHVTPATDRYALGLVAYRLIVGESYYRGAVMSILAELLHGVTSAPSTRDPSLGAAFDAWFLQACHRDPESRFASATQQIEALAEALGLPSDRTDARNERPSSVPPGAEARVALATAATVDASLLKRPYVRRALAGSALLLAVAGAVAYGGPERSEPVAPEALKASPPPPAARDVSTEERLAAEAPALNAAPPASAVPPTTPSAAGPAPEVTAARRGTGATRPRASPGASAVVSKAPVRDPFEDQK
jgi:serine/threonine protein kinase